MEIAVIETEYDTYLSAFGGKVPMRTAVVEFSGADVGEPVRMGFSHRDDDPEGMWLADFRVSSHGVAFSHGTGDRTCLKQIAGDLIVSAIEEAFAL